LRFSVEACACEILLAAKDKANFKESDTAFQPIWAFVGSLILMFIFWLFGKTKSLAY